MAPLLNQPCSLGGRRLNGTSRRSSRLVECTERLHLPPNAIRLLASIFGISFLPAKESDCSASSALLCGLISASFAVYKMLETGR